MRPLSFKEIEALELKLSGILDRLERSEIEWVPSHDWMPHDETSSPHELHEIINYIHDLLADSELKRYVTEAPEDEYFKNAWIDAGEFRKTQAYFQSRNEQSGYLIEREDLLTLHSPNEAGDVTLGKFRSLVDGKLVEASANFARMQHMFACQGRVLDLVDAYVNAVLADRSGEEGARLEKDDIEARPKDLIHAVELHIHEKLGFVDPFIHHHLETARAQLSDRAGEMDIITDAKAMKRYFGALAGHTEVERAACEQAAKLCARTKERASQLIGKKLSELEGQSP
jgi:hypothetical protein